jgi:transcriptional regulator with XRE-family HTH domain
MSNFGDLIRIAREEKGLFLRQVAAELDIDQAIISKFERNERKPTKEQVLKFAKFYKLDKETLLVEWLSDKVAYDLQDENLADKVLKAAEQKIKYDSYPHIRINISKNTDEIIKKQGAMPKSFGYYQWDADTNCAEIWQRRFIKVYNDVNDYKKSPIALQDEIDFLETLIRNKDEHDEHKIPEWEEKIEILQEQIEQLKNKPQNNKEVEEINFVEYYLKIFTEPLRNDLNFINKEFQIRNIYVSRPKGGDFNIQFAFVNGNVMFFDNLPQGYKRLFSIVFDIAYRSYILNQAKEPEGIVFIDEIELHLHPSLQQEVLGRLRKTFPKIQFIVSTHSLLVISNLKSENNSNKIIRLENDGLTYSNEPVENIYGIDYTTGLMDIMDAPYRPSTIDNLIDSYVILKLRNKEDDALKIWNEIFLVVGKDNKRIEKEITDKLEANR